jgi:hypothetical protein
MVSQLVLSQRGLSVLVWVFLRLYGRWPLEPAAVRPTPPKPGTPPRQRSGAPQPCIGATREPPCDACAEGGAPRREPPCAPPALRVAPRGRQRQGATSQQVWLAPDCRSGGWRGVGHLRANGHPRGGPGRQWPGPGGAGAFLEPHGPRCHGQRVSLARRVPVRGGRAAGRGLRGTARGGAVEPHTVWHGLLEAPEQRRAWAPSCQPDRHLTQVHLAALSAVLRALKDGTRSEEGALERRSRSPPWVWAALAPARPCLRTLEVGDRPRARAQRRGQQGAPGLAPAGAPRGRPDGFQESATALRTHAGQGSPRGGGGPRAALEQGRAAPGGPSHPACSERRNRSLRPHGAAVGRRGRTLCKGEDGMRPPLALDQVYDHLCLPQARLRPPRAPPSGGSHGRPPWRRD